jgi:hypothetical protein
VLSVLKHTVPGVLAVAVGCNEAERTQANDLIAYHSTHIYTNDDSYNTLEALNPFQ